MRGALHVRVPLGPRGTLVEQPFACVRAVTDEHAFDPHHVPQMTATRLMTLQTHGALELLVGALTMLAPFVLGFGPAATVVAGVVGAALVGLALSSTAHDHQRPALSVSTHHAADWGIGFGLIGAAVLLALAGDLVAGATLLVIAGALLVLNASTRYTARG